MQRAQWTPTIRRPLRRNGVDTWLNTTFCNQTVIKEIKGTLNYTYRTAKRIVIAVIGGTVLLAGIAMMVLPGPAFVVVPLGLAILGIEFAWARRWLRKVKEKVAQQMPRNRNRSKKF